MTQQQYLDEQLAKLGGKYERLNTRQQRYAIAEIDRTRLELIDLLTEYAKKDNTISKARLNSLLRDLEVLERSVRKNGMDAMESVVRESAEFGVQAGERSLVTALGEGAAITGSLNVLNRESFRYVVNRFGDDGLVLSDRVWQFAGEQRYALNRVVRSGIIRGESVNQMTAQVREVYANETWKIRRLVVTEGNTAYRVGTSYRAERSDYVKGVKVNDHTGHARHHTHRCYELSNATTSLGTGVYRPDDSRVYQIHPNCTAYLTYELIDEEVR
jgi:hypothetical protein